MFGMLKYAVAVFDVVVVVGEFVAVDAAFSVLRHC